jgi:anti-sigma factor RsiW
MTDPHLDTPAGELACTEVVEMVTDYLEGALSTHDAGRLEHHLDTCPGCTEYVDQMRAIAGSLGGLTPPSMPAETRDGLVARFARLRQR